MQKKNLKNWLKKIGIALLLVLSFSFVNAYAEGEECNVDADCNIGAGELCIDGECTYVGLEEGGTGLSIPTGDVQISKDIVQTRTFGDLLITIVNYFVGFLGTIAVISLSTRVFYGWLQAEARNRSQKPRR